MSRVLPMDVLYRIFDGRYGWLDDVEALMSGQQAGVIAYATRAQLDADLNHAVNTPAIVTNDPDGNNNTYWIKVGAAGAGSWSKSNWSADLGVVARRYETLADADAAAVAAGKQLIISTVWNVVPVTLSAPSVKIIPGGKLDGSGSVAITGQFDGSDGCFGANQTVTTGNGYYNLAWFPGNSANEKWDALRRGFVTNGRYVVEAKRPSPGDPAASIPAIGTPSWKVTAPLLFDDPENLLTFMAHAPFTAVGAVSSMFEFSPTNKTENIYFPYGLELDGVNTALKGIHIKGGARIQFNGPVHTTRFNGNPVHIETTTSPTDEITFDFLDVTDFSGVGLYIDGTNQVSLSTHIKFLLFNGAKSGATNAVVVKGTVRDLTIDHIFENIAGTLYDVSDSLVRLETTAQGSPGGGLTIGKIFSNISQKPALKTVDSSGGTKQKISGKVGWIHSNATAVPHAQLAYTNDFEIGGIWSRGISSILLTIASDCDATYVNSTPASRITNNGYNTHIAGPDSAVYVRKPTTTEPVEVAKYEVFGNAGTTRGPRHSFYGPNLGGTQLIATVDYMSHNVGQSSAVISTLVSGVLAPRITINTDGSITLHGLAGTGTRAVSADSTGKLLAP